jgi:GTPase SAR1 family protein
MILGDGAVGKTSIIKRFASDEYAEQHIATLGLDFCPQKHTTKTGITSNIKIWDTAG